jgi:hypothetical protein
MDNNPDNESLIKRFGKLTPEQKTKFVSGLSDSDASDFSQLIEAEQGAISKKYEPRLNSMKRFESTLLGKAMDLPQRALHAVGARPFATSSEEIEFQRNEEMSGRSPELGIAKEDVKTAIGVAGMLPGGNVASGVLTGVADTLSSLVEGLPVKQAVKKGATTGAITAAGGAAIEHGLVPAVKAVGTGLKYTGKGLSKLYQMSDFYKGDVALEKIEALGEFGAQTRAG